MNRYKQGGGLVLFSVMLLCYGTNCAKHKSANTEDKQSNLNSIWIICQLRHTSDLQMNGRMKEEWSKTKY